MVLTKSVELCLIMYPGECYSPLLLLKLFLSIVCFLHVFSSVCSSDTSVLPLALVSCVLNSASIAVVTSFSNADVFKHIAEILDFIVQLPHLCLVSFNQSVQPAVSLCVPFVSLHPSNDWSGCRLLSNTDVSKGFQISEAYSYLLFSLSLSLSHIEGAFAACSSFI